MWVGPSPNPVVGIVGAVDAVGRRNPGHLAVVDVVIVVALLLPLAYAFVVGVPNATNKPS